MAVYKKLYFTEFDKSLRNRKVEFYSFYENTSPVDELDRLFDKIGLDGTKKHFPIYRLCDAEYFYCLGRKLPLNKMSFFEKLRFELKTVLIKLGFANQKTWHGENYSINERKKHKEKYIDDVQQIAREGFLAPHLMHSEGRFCEQYNDAIITYFYQNNIIFKADNYFPFYFVYVILTLDRYKQRIFKDKSVLIITSLNERKKRSNFEEELAKENVRSVHFYEISPEKSMLEVIDKDLLPSQVDLILLGAGIGSANIMNQIKHLNALCIDAGHALDCFSTPALRAERLCLLPD